MPTSASKNWSCSGCSIEREMSLSSSTLLVEAVPGEMFNFQSGYFSRLRRINDCGLQNLNNLPVYYRMDLETNSVERERFGWCPQCGHEQVFKLRTPIHRYHAIASILTLGLWLIPWLVLTLASKSRRWECEQCAGRGNSTIKWTEEN